jgi:hypothetical protein
LAIQAVLVHKHLRLSLLAVQVRHQSQTVQAQFLVVAVAVPMQVNHQQIQPQLAVITVAAVREMMAAAVVAELLEWAVTLLLQLVAPLEQVLT